LIASRLRRAGAPSGHPPGGAPVDKETSMIDPKRPLFRSQARGMFGGVCAGLADWAEWDVTVMRAAWIVTTALTGFVLGAAAYLALWLSLPVGSAHPAAR
jgi:phage shock protein PspC (stress-responsive transcriptional regulator)